MRDVQKPDHVSLKSLIEKLKEGRFVIPDFQRDFEWMPWDISELMRSIFLDYYIGGLLLWKGDKENFAALSCEPIYGYKGEAKQEYIVLDGQQRLTAMYYVFVAPDVPLPNRASRAFYFIRVNQFMDENYDEAFYYDWLSSRWEKIFSDKKNQYEEHIFPLSVIGAGGWELANWAQGYEQYWSEKAKAASDSGQLSEAEQAAEYARNASKFGQYLRDITENYQVAYVELERQISIDKVCDIFTQINSRGIRLDVFDLINALLKPKGLQLKHLWKQAEPRLSKIDVSRMDRYILQVMSLLKQGYCSPKYLYYLLPGEKKTVRALDGSKSTEILINDIEEFKTLWDQSIESMENSIRLIQSPQEFGAISSRYTPYQSILPAFSAMQSHIKQLPPEKKLDAQRKVRSWYWASVFTNRYSGAVESTSAKDFQDFKSWLEDETVRPVLLAEFETRFRALDLRREAKRGSSIYNGIFNLLTLNGARDWVTGSAPQYDNLDDHHIIPSSWERARELNKDINGTSIDTILNRTPLTAETNRHVINDRLPNEYIPEMIANNGEEVVRDIFASHLISSKAFDILLRNPFTPDDFNDFVSEREQSIKQAIESLFIRGRLDLQPLLRDLDERIEKVEISLRDLIQHALNNDPAKLPGHIRESIDLRLEGVFRRSPSLANGYYDQLTTMLEFADLRDLENIIVSKSYWVNFETLFVNKTQLSSRFNQLAELRNGIRHSRTVTAVARKDGEAALLWFEDLLKL